MNPILLACIGIVVGEFYGSFVGGGGIVVQFVLVGLLDMDLRSAIALDNASVLGSEIGLLVMLLRRQKVHLYYLPFIGTVLIGSYVGAWGLHTIPLLYLKMIFVGVLFLIVVRSFFFTRKTDVPPEPTTPFQLTALYVFGLFVGTYNAFLSVGDFIFGLMGLMFFLHFTYHRSLFLLSLALVFGRAFAIHHYFGYGLIDTQFWIPMFGCALATGLVAGSLVHKMKSEHLEPILKVLGLLLAIYLTYTLLA